MLYKFPIIITKAGSMHVCVTVYTDMHTWNCSIKGASLLETFLIQEGQLFPAGKSEKKEEKKHTKTWNENFVSKCSRALTFYTEGYWHQRWLTGLDVQNSRQPSDYPQPIQSFPQAMGASYFCAEHERGGVCHTGDIQFLYWLLSCLVAVPTNHYTGHSV